MHELALARSLTELVDEYAAENDARRVLRINVRLGELSAMTRALHFCFSAVAEGTSCEGAVLDIEEVPVRIYCRHCETNRAPSGRHSFRCVECGMPSTEIVAGREMQLVSIELGPVSDGVEVPKGAESKLAPTSHVVR